jgi:D-sedoheptulose 7-phosphate isomerase
VFGNGGCSSIAQLMEAAFVGRYKSEKLSRSFISLSSDATVLTTLANDFGFENIYKKQLVAHLTPEDCVIGLSTSGNSQNVLNGIAYAKDQKAITIGMTGMTGGKLKDVADLCIRVPSNNPSFIEAVMSSIYSIICKTIE